MPRLDLDEPLLILIIFQILKSPCVHVHVCVRVCVYVRV